MKYLLSQLVVVLFSLSTLFAQNTKEDVILKAMKDELNRNMSSLHLEGIEKPFYISYLVVSGKSIQIEGSLGALVKSKTAPLGKGFVQVLVGDYHLNNLNFKGGRWEWSNIKRPQFPVIPDYYGYRNELWMITDQVYKENGEKLAKKTTAMKQQMLTLQDTVPDDFSKAPAVKYVENISESSIKIQEWENLAKSLSSIFLAYSDFIESNVSLSFYPLQVHFVNSEGSEISFPMNYFMLRVSAQTLADDGERIFDEKDFFLRVPDQLPPSESLRKNIIDFADNLSMLSKAPVIDEDYFGPVLIEGEAAAELLMVKLFGSYNGLYANRVPICMDENMKNEIKSSNKSLEMKKGRRILPSTFTVTSRPDLEEWDGQVLIGQYKFDAEGISPKKVNLVESGILKQVLTDRIPTYLSPETNGNSRIAMNTYNLQQKGPGVIHVQTSKGQSSKKLKAELIKAAKKEGLDYALIIRRTSPKINTDIFYSDDSDKRIYLSPLNVYKVDLNTGKETLVRSAEIQNLPVSVFRNIMLASNKEIAHNMLLFDGDRYYSGSSLVGIPASIILPDGLLFEELEINKKDMSGMTKPPVVSNPVK